VFLTEKRRSADGVLLFKDLPDYTVQVGMEETVEYRIMQEDRYRCRRTAPVHQVCPDLFLGGGNFRKWQAPHP
jgi:hypothetical protein